MPSGYDNEASAAAAAAAAAAAVDSGLVDDDQLVTMMTDASQPGATGKRKRDANDEAAVGVVDPTPIFASDGRPLPPPQLPPPQLPPAAVTATNNNNNQITIRPSPEGLPDKPKTSRINWGKSPHKERLTTILSDWFSKTGMALDPANNNAPIQDYRVYASKVGISRTTLFKYIHKDPSKRRMIKDDDSSGNRGKKRLMSDEDIKFIVKELKDGIKDDNSPPSRNEAVDLIIKHFGLSRQAASRQLSRHVLPLVNVDDSGNNTNDTSTATAANGDDDEEDGKMPAYDTSITAMEGIIPTSTTTLDHPQEMKKRNIVISGVTSGLGRALLGYYYNHGHTVSGCGRRSSEITVLKNQFPNAHLSVVDVSDDTQVQAWAESICTAAGTGDNKVDLVIANAGVSPETMFQNKKAWEVPLQDFDNTIDVNIKGVSNMIRHFVPRMVENNVGTFVALSSGLGRSPNPFHAAYCASKWAVEGMVKSLAMSLPEGPMCAVPLAPGVVQTDSSGKNDTGGNIDTWVEAAAPMILGLSRKDNGKSLSVKGFYSVRYRQTWSFPDGSGIPKQPGHVF